MSDSSRQYDTLPDVERPGKVDTKLTPAGQAAMQGVEQSPDSPDQAARSPMTLNASTFKPETRQALREQGLDNVDDILADHRGVKAENLTQTVLTHEGLPDGAGSTLPLRAVIPGHYDDQGHGIDLIGVAPDGRPIPIEVKKRADANLDRLGHDSAKISPATEELRADILRERTYNPALRDKALDLAEKTAHGESKPDPELSNEQMAGLWTRDRWLKLVDDPERKEALLAAGIRPEFVEPANLTSAYSPQWEEILNGRTVVIVSGDKSDVTNTLFREAAFKRGANVAVIDLKQ